MPFADIPRTSRRGRARGLDAWLEAWAGEHCFSRCSHVHEKGLRLSRSPQHSMLSPPQPSGLGALRGQSASAGIPRPGYELLLRVQHHLVGLDRSRRLQLDRS